RGKAHVLARCRVGLRQGRVDFREERLCAACGEGGVCLEKLRERFAVGARGGGVAEAELGEREHAFEQRILRGEFRARRERSLASGRKGFLSQQRERLDALAL